MTPSVKEALEALAEWEPDGDRELDAFLFVKAHLEAQAAEAACWLVIEKWCLEHRLVGCELFASTRLDPEWVARFNNESGDEIGSVPGHPTRLEALQAAAAWIKKEGSK